MRGQQGQALDLVEKAATALRQRRRLRRRPRRMRLAHQRGVRGQLREHAQRLRFIRNFPRSRGERETKSAGITREALYKALRLDSAPRFDTVNRVRATPGVHFIGITTCILGSYPGYPEHGHIEFAYSSSCENYRARKFLVPNTAGAGIRDLGKILPDAPPSR